MRSCSRFCAPNTAQSPITARFHADDCCWICGAVDPGPDLAWKQNGGKSTPPMRCQRRRICCGDSAGSPVRHRNGVSPQHNHGRNIYPAGRQHEPPRQLARQLAIGAVAVAHQNGRQLLAELGEQHPRGPRAACGVDVHAHRVRAHTPTASSADCPRARRAHESSSASRRPGPSAPHAGARQSPHQGARTPPAAATGRRPTCPAQSGCPSSPVPAPPRATGDDARSTPAQTTPTRSPRRRCWQTAAPVVAPPPRSSGRTDTSPGREDDGYDAHRPRPRPR